MSRAQILTGLAQRAIRPLFLEATRRFRPELVVIGIESQCGIVLPLAKSVNLPVVRFARGNPTAAIMEGLLPRDLAEAALSAYRQTLGRTTEAAVDAYARELGAVARPATPRCATASRSLS